MTSPSTKRDQRRETRKEQFAARQEERRQARERARRIQLARRYGTIGGGILIVILIGVLVAHFAFPGTSTAPQTLQPANGNPVDNIACVPSEGQVQHFHDQMYVYQHGQPVPVPQNIGIVIGRGCLYSLHTHDATGIMHIESDSPTQAYYLGNFFDIWGQTLSTTQFMGNKVDSSNKLVIDVYDESGKLTTYTGDPAKLQLAPHQTIYLLYDSPNVKTAPFTQWNGL